MEVFVFSRGATKLPGAAAVKARALADREREEARAAATAATEAQGAVACLPGAEARPRLPPDGEVVDLLASYGLGGLLSGGDSLFKADKSLGRGGFGTVYRASVESCKTLRPGTLVALKIDGNVRGHAAAARDSLPSLQRDGRVPLASLRRGCVLREAHAYALLHEAPASAHIPAFCVPLVCDAVVAHRLKLPTSDCSVAYSTEPAYALALPLLGSSVHALSCETELSQQEVLALGVQMITALRSVHERGLLHCDIKPDNFCVPAGVEELQQAEHLVLIDYGLAVEVSHELRKQNLTAAARNCDAARGSTWCGEVAPRDSSGSRGGSWHCDESLGEDLERGSAEFYGTPHYASRRALAMEPLSYRDDLESVFYCIAELLLDELPWAGRVVSLRQADQDGESFDVRDWCSHSFNGVRACRRDFDYDTLVAMLPPPMQALWRGLNRLQFGEAPDYAAMIAMLQSSGTPHLHAHHCAAKRSRDGEAALSEAATMASVAVVHAPACMQTPAASGAGVPVTGPAEPNGKRARAEIVAAMLREE